MAVQDLSKTNKSLRADWKERELAILKLVRNFVQSAQSKESSSNDKDVATRRSRPTYSVPRQICWETAFSIVHDLPQSLVDHDTLSKVKPTFVSLVNLSTHVV